jgi:SPP1 gp7 family putative phage head morphogenesis protein
MLHFPGCGLRTRVFDYRETQEEAAAFAATRRAEIEYATQLRKIARQIADFVKTFGPDATEQIEQSLRDYADIIEPWATTVAQRMVDGVRRRDERAWRTHARELSAALRTELFTMPTGDLYHRLMVEQVKLIKSLPIDAANRVHEIVTGNIYSGARPTKLIEEIMRTGEVTKSRANLIARTETARASSTFVEARARHIGSTGYLWKTVRDRAVRPSHRAMEGKFVAWDSPPTLDNLKGHAGALPNCRCHPSPVFPDKYFK